MNFVITPKAQTQIEHQLSLGIDRHGLATAQKTFTRVERFFATTLVDYPRTGTFLPDKRLYESLIPRTPFVYLSRRARPTTRPRPRLFPPRPGSHGVQAKRVTTPQALASAINKNADFASVGTPLRAV